MALDPRKCQETSSSKGSGFQTFVFLAAEAILQTNLRQNLKLQTDRGAALPCAAWAWPRDAPSSTQGSFRRALRGAQVCNPRLAGAL